MADSKQLPRITDSVGTISQLPLNIDTIHQMISIVNDPRVTTSYNKNALLHLIPQLSKYDPILSVVGFYLSKHKLFEDNTECIECHGELAGFAVLVKDNGVYQSLFFFTAVGERNKAFAAFLCYYISKVNEANKVKDYQLVKFTHFSYINTYWQQGFLDKFLQPLAKSSLGDFTLGTIAYDRARLVQELTFKYSQDVPSSLDEFMSHFGKLDDLEMSKASQVSPKWSPKTFRDDAVIIITMGSPGVGKSHVMSQLKKFYPFFKSFHDLDIDHWVEPRIESYLEDHEEIKKETVFAMYEEEWKNFVDKRKHLIDNNMNFIVYATSRQPDLIQEYIDMAPNHRVVGIDFDVSDKKIIEQRIREREKSTGRPVPLSYLQQCLKQIPASVCRNTFVKLLPIIALQNNWTSEKPQDVQLMFIINHEESWQKYNDEPTLWVNDSLNAKTSSLWEPYLRALIFGTN